MCSILIAVSLFWLQISDQKPLGCWSVKHGQILTCPVVCNFETHEYIAVHDDKVRAFILLLGKKDLVGPPGGM